MNKTIITRILCLLCLSQLAIIGCNGQTPSSPDKSAKSIQPGDTISRATASPESNLFDPDDPAWANVQEYQIDLSIAPPVHPSVLLHHDTETAPVPVFFRIASDKDRFMLRLRWSDSTQNITDTFDQFSDGAAVQFALAGGRESSYMMGTPDAPVNIWYWKGGNKRAQNLAAAGFGSTSLLEDQNIAATGRYSSHQNGEWNVVLSGPLNSNSEYQANLNGNQTIYLSLAVWQGQDKQRDGLKRTTVGWITVEPDNAL